MVLTQFESEAAGTQFVRSGPFVVFTHSHSHGMRRAMPINLAIPQILQLRRVRQMLRRRPWHLPFVPSDSTVPQAEFPRPLLTGERELGDDAVLVANLITEGTTEQKAVDPAYAGRMLDLMAEGRHGPMHIGRAVTIEGETEYDRVAPVHYPGVDYFAEMMGSEFYQGIVGDKQLGDSQAPVTVPLTNRLN